MNTRVAIAAAIIACLASPATGEQLQLIAPVQCTIGETCWIQQYVDRDQGQGVRDYACGAETYDGHDGTDFRIRDVASVADGVLVVAAAAGIVNAVRDDMPDHLLRTDADRQAIAGRECGNGVLLVHEDGWQTQYCHLRQGSLGVAPGQRVVAGDRLGEVGYSGDAAFPHVHLTVRKDGTAVDPFRPADAPGSCDAAGSLWLPEARDQLAYAPGAILRIGFSPAAIEMAVLEEGSVNTDPPSADWPALVAYGWAINLQQGDEIAVRLEGPSGISTANAASLEHSKAQYMLFSGIKRPADGWPAGDYVAHFAVTRAGAVVLEGEARAALR